MHLVNSVRLASASTSAKTLSEERWRLASGQEKIYTILRGPHGVGVLAIDEAARRLLVVRQPRPAVDEVVVELVGGRIETEDALTTAQRELAEEAGLHAARWETVCEDLFVSPGGSNQHFTLFFAFELSPTPKDPRDLDIALEWVDFSDFDELLACVRDMRAQLALLYLQRRLLQRRIADLERPGSSP